MSSFRARWRELRHADWLSKSPTGLSNDFTYLKPGKTNKDARGVDYFVGEKELMSYLDRIDLAELARQKEAKSPDYDAVIAAQNLPDTQLPGNPEIDEHLPDTQLPDYLEIDDDHLQDTQLHDNLEVDEEPEPGSHLVPRPDVPLIATSPHIDKDEAQVSDESQSSSMPPQNAPQTTSGPSTQDNPTSDTGIDGYM
ncbi:hypothetical protein V7S43_009922 [Phytophthora oleae]|uniref:Uncharacterized protein n=1 Tax=Phytophthora oleae TaxID=2107226 RepID=A0ABD3FG59_9STRA